jgi:predicted secreted protein
MRVQVALLAAGLTLASCGSSSHVLTEQDANRTVTVHSGETITLDLEDSWGPPGVSLTWKATASNSSVLQLASVEDPSQHLVSLGGPGGQQIVKTFQANFRAVASGTTQIRAHAAGTCEAMAVCNRDRDITITVVVS